jgi:alcohol dehydrogenase
VAARVFVVASERALGSAPAAAALVRAGARHYSRVSPNPTTGQALELASAIEEARPRFVLAVGGGSTIDLAKAGRLLLTPSPRALWSAHQGHWGAFRSDPPQLVAVPTTAGTGSEMTPFATLYHQGRKVSVDRSECRPDTAVLDGMLLRNTPMAVAVPAVLDAMCHAIESYWSLAATVRSRRYAHVATVALSRSATAHESQAGLPDAKAHERLLASALAGLAIADTRTTAVHGFSYALTARHGIPHGFACALSLAWMRRYNWEFRSLGRPGVASVLRELGCHPQADSGAPISIVLRLLS